MQDHRYRDDTAVEQRDRAQRRVRTITLGALAGGALVTAVGAGLAVAYAPGRASSSSSSPTSNATGTDPNAVPGPELGDQGFQSSGQVPSFGGFGRGHAVSGGS